MAARFVNLMDGHIWIESEGLGKGCMVTFIVKLGIPEQLKESKFLVMPKIPASHVRTNFSGLKVLVVDDNRLVTGSVSDSIPLEVLSMLFKCHDNSL